MSNFENLSAKLFAAVGALAFSVVFFATAIVPASPAGVLPGVIA